MKIWGFTPAHPARLQGGGPTFSAVFDTRHALLHLTPSIKVRAHPIVNDRIVYRPSKGRCLPVGRLRVLRLCGAQSLGHGCLPCNAEAFHSISVQLDSALRLLCGTNKQTLAWFVYHAVTHLLVPRCQKPPAWPYTQQRRERDVYPRELLSLNPRDMFKSHRQSDATLSCCISQVRTSPAALQPWPQLLSARRRYRF